MTLGILKEPEWENRVAIGPDNIPALKKLNIASILVESGAGEKAFFSDDQYKEKEASISDADTILKTADLILCVHPLSDDQMASLRPEQGILGQFNPLQNKDYVRQLLDKKLTAFSLDAIPRTTRAQSMDVLSSMATVAGYKAVLQAATLLPRFFPMFMTAAGTIKPAKVLILGAGVAGLQAIATARRLGAVVEAFDVRAAAKEEVLSLGAKFVEVEGAIDDKAAGGYAVEQTEEYKQKQAALIQEHATKADVIICTAQIPGRKAPLLIQKDTVENMKPGSVIVDLAASTGGNCAVTKNDETILHNNVYIIGQSNLASTTPSDASNMFSKNAINFLKLIIDKEGNINYNFEDELVTGTCIAHDGVVHNERVKNALAQ